MTPFPPTIVLLSTDAAVATAIAAAAAAWLVRRGVRAFRGRPSGGGCCGSAHACSPSERDAAEVRAAAARLNREGSRDAR